MATVHKEIHKISMVIKFHFIEIGVIRKINSYFPFSARRWVIMKKKKKSQKPCSRPLLLNFPCHQNYLGTLKNTDTWDYVHRLWLIILGCALGIEIFQYSPNDSEMQPRLRITDLHPWSSGEPQEHVLGVQTPPHVCRIRNLYLKKIAM